MAADRTPRIPPLPAADRDDSTQALLSMTGPFADNNIFTTMVRHPRLFKQWVPFGTAMLYGHLPARDRELLILRTAHRCRCQYEWSQHERIAQEVGVSQREVEQIRHGTDLSDWSPIDAALVHAVDELIDLRRVTDSTWSTLTQRYDERLLIEVLMVVGHYYALGLTLNTLGVEVEPTTSP